MPAFNAGKTISDSIESVINQSFKEWELLVIDDGSSDNTVLIVVEFQNKDERIKLLKLEKNGGLSNARNKGCEIARGDFVAFLDSDDLWNPVKLERQVEYHQSHTECVISHTDFEGFTETGVIKRPWKNFLIGESSKQGNLLPILYYQNVVGVLTVMIRREIFNSVGGFDVSLWTFEDQDLWIRIADRGYHFGYIDKPLAMYRKSSSMSISQRIGKYKKAYKRFLEKYMNCGLNKRLAWGYYFRYFGTVYFKRRQYHLANLYFMRSLKLHQLSFVGFTTMLYLLYNNIQASMRFKD